MEMKEIDLNKIFTPEDLESDPIMDETVDDDIYCDLDPTKICDNCFRCLETDADYEIVEIDGIYSDGKRIY